MIPLSEFDEIDGGICEDMSYEEIRSSMPQVYLERKQNKYEYIYPEGEGYTSMKERINRGIKKALYLSGNANSIMIVGHQARESNDPFPLPVPENRGCPIYLHSPKQILPHNIRAG